MMLCSNYSTRHPTMRTSFSILTGTFQVKLQLKRTCFDRTLHAQLMTTGSITLFLCILPRAFIMHTGMRQNEGRQLIIVI